MYPYIVFTETYRFSTYGLMFIIGYICAVAVAMRSAGRYGAYRNDVLYCSVYIVLGIGAGAKVMYFLSKVPRVVMHFDVFMKMWDLSPIEALNYLFGGLTFFGGLFGAFIGFLIYCRQYKIETEPMGVAMVPYIPFVHAFGRVGCFLAGCCYGIPYSGVFAVQFPDSDLDPALSEVTRFPVQLLEALVNLVIFALLLLLRKNHRMRAKGLLVTYLASYCVARFFLEMLRGDADRGKYSLLSTSQIISLAILILLLVQYLRSVYAKKYHSDNNDNEHNE